MIQKLLIANRGEIAVRIIRAAREMGIRTVAVYSDADKAAIHSQLADQSVSLGNSAPAESYLNIEKLIAAAKATGADAIHPGYGFLSERAEFSEACDANGITFVGPSPAAMRQLGSKAAAKTIAVKENVPIVPGHFQPGASVEELRAAAEAIGYPIMLKASAGGGGRGMRVLRDGSAFEDELTVAADEALRSFGDGAMMVEKLVDRPRHIEVQLLADHYGNIACLFERECSLQRRHQKLLEEAPSPFLMHHGEMWQAMREAASRLATATAYVGAGTVEFMVDEAAEKFYFLEVNTRLQVEHPVTEAITGLDLVKWQLRIASGEVLALDQSLQQGHRAAITGHSIEVRIVAEDPANNFQPSIGKILAWAEPKAPGVRVDTGFGRDSEVSRFYDSLIAKVIVHAESRNEAIRKLQTSLMDFHILGVKTNIGYLLDVISHPDFQSGQIDTGFLGREYPTWSPGSLPSELGALVEQAERQATTRPINEMKHAVWDAADRFRVTKASTTR